MSVTSNSTEPAVPQSRDGYRRSKPIQCCCMSLRAGQLPCLGPSTSARDKCMPCSANRSTGRLSSCSCELCCAVARMLGKWCWLLTTPHTTSPRQYARLLAIGRRCCDYFTYHLTVRSLTRLSGFGNLLGDCVHTTGTFRTWPSCGTLWPNS